MKDKKKIEYTSIGGQALIEGIMMKGPKKTGFVIRKTDGTLEKKVEDNKSLKDRYPLFKLPFIRGVFTFFGSMASGIKALNYSASFFEPTDEEMPKTEQQSEPDKPIEKKGDKMSDMLIVISVIIGVGLSVLLFVILPTFIIGLFGTNLSFFWKNILEGVTRITIFILYVYLVSKLKDIKRVFMYHGAEHKTIFCYEKKEELTIENVRLNSRLHPRCGTSFLLIVMVISILVFSFLKWDTVIQRSIMRIILMPLVMAISYEIIKLAGKYDNIFTRIISAPGMMLQRLTTKEPDDSMIEVAIEAINLVREDRQPLNNGENTDGDTF